MQGRSLLWCLLYPRFTCTHMQISSSQTLITPSDSSSWWKKNKEMLLDPLLIHRVIYFYFEVGKYSMWISQELIYQGVSPFTVKWTFRPRFSLVKYHLQLSPTSRYHDAIFFFFLFLLLVLLHSTFSPLAGLSADSCNIYGCLEQTLAAGNWRAHLLIPKKLIPNLS